MKGKKNTLDFLKYQLKGSLTYVFAVCLCVLIWYSEFSLWIKLLAMTISVLYIFAIKYSEWIGVKKTHVVVGLVVIATVINLSWSSWGGSYWDYLHQYGVSYNKNTQWATTQNPYVWNTANSDVILPTLLQDKNVYIADDSIYYSYVEFFCKEIEPLESVVNFDFEILKTEFLKIGRMAIQAVDYLFEPDEKKALDENKARNNVQATLYISSSDVAKAEEVIVFEDDVYNMYIMTWEEYEILVDELLFNGN